MIAVATDFHYRKELALLKRKKTFIRKACNPHIIIPKNCMPMRGYNRPSVYKKSLYTNGNVKQCNIIIFWIALLLNNSFIFQFPCKDPIGSSLILHNLHILVISGANFNELLMHIILLKQNGPSLVKSDYRPILHSIFILSKQQCQSQAMHMAWNCGQ